MRATRGRFLGVTAMAAAFVLAGAGPALADDVTATSASFAAGTQTIYLNMGQSASVTLSYIVTGEGKDPVDGKAGCNLVGKDSQLALDVVTSGDTGVTDLPTTGLVFAACPSSTDPATITLDFTATLPGTETYTFPVDTADTVASGTFDSSAATFTVVVTSTEGRDAPAIANDWLHNTATADELAACQAALGTNTNQANWQGNLIEDIAQMFPDETFPPDQEYVVVDAVKSLCGLTTS